MTSYITALHHYISQLTTPHCTIPSHS